MTRFGVPLPDFSGFEPAGFFEQVAGLATAAAATRIGAAGKAPGLGGR